MVPAKQRQFWSLVVPLYLSNSNSGELGGAGLAGTILHLSPRLQMILTFMGVLSETVRE